MVDFVRPPPLTPSLKNPGYAIEVTLQNQHFPFFLRFSTTFIWQQLPDTFGGKQRPRKKRSDSNLECKLDRQFFNSGRARNNR